jgi:hypothetical protein
MQSKQTPRNKMITSRVSEIFHPKKLNPLTPKFMEKQKKENADKKKALDTVAKAKATADAAAAKAIDTTLNGVTKADKTRVKAAKIRNDAALAQKEPEDFNADEQEAAQAVIDNAKDAKVKTAKKTLADAIKANTKK